MYCFHMMILVFATLTSVMRGSSIANVITSPGVYNFENFIADPAITDDAVIIIQSSDVTVDFTGHMISQLSGNTVAGLKGIVVENGLKNINIQNVTIRGLTGKGIVVGEGCSDIAFTNISIEGCGDSGAELIGTVSNNIKNVNIKDCYFRDTVYASANVYGLRMVYGENIVINNCFIQNNDAQTSAFGFGISLENCVSCRISHCNLFGNGGSNLGVGIQLSNTDWALLQQIQVRNSIARTTTTGKAVGILLNACENCYALNVHASHNINSVGIGIGINAAGGTGNVIDTCFAHANEGDIIGAGIILDNLEKNTIIIRSKCNNNIAQSGGTAYGIFLDTAAYCDIWYNYCAHNASVTTAYGLKDSVTGTSNLILGNKAFDNTTAGFDVDLGGIKVFPLVSGIFGTVVLATTSKYMNVGLTI